MAEAYCSLGAMLFGLLCTRMDKLTWIWRLELEGGHGVTPWRHLLRHAGRPKFTTHKGRPIISNGRRIVTTSPSLEKGCHKP